jgi:hypothetical protein
VALNHFEFHRLVFAQGAKTFALDGAVMHEDIRAVFLGNESETFGVIKPLYLASYFHAATQPPDNDEAIRLTSKRYSSQKKKGTV